MKTELEVVQSAIADTDPEGEIPEITLALFIVSIAQKKEYNDYSDLVEDAQCKFEEYYGYRLQ